MSRLRAVGRLFVAPARAFRPFRRLLARRWRREAQHGAEREIMRPSAISLLDLGDEAVAGLFARPGRMSLTVLGTVIGLAALVATLGLSRTAGNRIVGRFDELAATQILVSVRPTAAVPGAEIIPWDAPERLRRLNGVVAAGTVSTVDTGEALVSTSPVSDPRRQTEFRLTVQAVSPGLWEAVRADLRTGRFPDAGHSQRGERIVVLGPSAALKLGINGVEQLPAIRIGDDIFLVIGILEGVARQPNLLRRHHPGGHRATRVPPR